MIDHEKVYHIHPLDDLKEHYLECIYPPIENPYCPCECEPKYIQEDDTLLIVHNSFDGREGVEWANEVLKSLENKK